MIAISNDWCDFETGQITRPLDKRLYNLEHVL